jgi:hypothetical protein
MIVAPLLGHAPGTNPVVECGAKTNGAFPAAQVVDELRVLVTPALDGAELVQGIVDYRNGLAGVVRLQFDLPLGLGTLAANVRRPHQKSMGVLVSSSAPVSVTIKFCSNPAVPTPGCDKKTSAAMTIPA